MALYDCFMYFDEDMLMDIRLNVLKNHVDKFIIAEATRTHSGKEKEMTMQYFQKLGRILKDPN